MLRTLVQIVLKTDAICEASRMRILRSSGWNKKFLKSTDLITSLFDQTSLTRTA